MIRFMYLQTKKNWWLCLWWAIVGALAYAVVA